MTRVYKSTLNHPAHFSLIQFGVARLWKLTMLEFKLSFLLLFLASANVVTGNPLPKPLWGIKGPCDDSPCKNGGTCKVVFFNYECTCAKGWKGEQCTTKVKPCEYSPCKNGATCTNKNHEVFECACKDGYRGETCSERIQCENPLDLLFVVDTASWQQSDYFENVPDFMSDVINWLKISDLATEVGLITFTYEKYTKVQFLPGTYTDASKLQSELRSLKPNSLIPFIGWEGSTAKALKLANDEVFKTADEHPNAEKVIVLITPQPPVDSKSGAIAEAKKLKAKGVEIVAIDLLYGLKTFFDPNSAREELAKISSPIKPIESEYFDLDDHVREVADLLCSFTRNPCDGIECGDKKTCTYDHETTWCICKQSENDCEAEPCDKLPCKNDGECENIDDETFKCKCTAKWKGETCEQEALPCDSTPCKNSGKCENVDENTFKCTCDEDWEGITCEEKIHPCDKDESPCKNEGECEKIEDKFVCKCSQGWKGDTCEEKVYPCDSKPCKNSGECKNVGENTFECTCTEDWTGSTCETKVHPCDKAESPCKNGGACEEDGDEFLCICNEDWTGPTCEEKVHPCNKTESPCKNGATCEELADQFVCKCTDDWEGTTCEKKVHPCDKEESPCKNGGACEKNGDEFVCKCNEDWTGETCEIKVHPCDKAESPCKNGGACEKNGDEFICECTEDWTGDTCEIKVHPCDKAESPCKNGGVCKKNGDEFVCKCTEDWTGETCEIKVHHCDKAESPCKNGGACEKNGDEFVCKCTEDWTGDTCEIKVHPCDKTVTPCKNKGVCVEKETTFTCECAPGYEGETCEEKVNPCDNDPCKNGATCKVSSSSIEAVCICPPGFIGKTCEEKEVIVECQCSPNFGGENGYCYKPVVVELNKTVVDTKAYDEVTDACENHPCQNGATCESEDDTYICRCPVGFDGPTCVNKVRPCESTPCQNDAICEEKGCLYVCHCREGYKGFQCETKVTPCESSPCKNGATCEETGSDAPDGFNCKCADGYEGVYCDKKINPCESSPCKNWATCVAEGETYVCHCSSRYKGSNCEEEVKPCDSSPCKNDGICENDGENFKCHCVGEFRGSTCEEKINPCESSPCKNWATCMTEEETYVCHCSAGYKGLTCEEEVSPCDNYKCLNGGECTVGGNGEPSCKCKEGFVGEKCGNVAVQGPTNQAASTCGKCQNGGVCTGQKCQCAYGYSGDSCEKPDTIGFFQKTTKIFVKTAIPNSLDAMTVCLRVYSFGQRNQMYFMSYATKSGEKFAFYKYASTLGARVGTVRRQSSKAVINDKICHHICFTWKSAGGKWAFYKDGKSARSGSGLSSGQNIPGGGVLSLAQRTPNPQLATRYVGRITDLNIWSKVLTPNEIQAMSKCGVSAVGDVKSWPDFRLEKSSKFAKYVKNVCPLANC